MGKRRKKAVFCEGFSFVIQGKCWGWRFISTMTDPDFIDFMMGGGHYLLFPEDFDEVECPNCGQEIEVS